MSIRIPFFSNLFRPRNRSRIDEDYGQTTNVIIRNWSYNPEKFFFDSRGRPAKLGKPLPGGDMFPRGYCLIPDFISRYPHPDFGLKIGYVQNIQMYRGIVKIGHIGLNIDLTRHELQVGKIFLDGLLVLMRSFGAIQVQFHESHPSRLDHYRRFFEKHCIPETSSGVWSVSLYPDGVTPDWVTQKINDLERT